jgi:hypothetical protein
MMAQQRQCNPSRRQLRRRLLQPTMPEQAGFVAAAQIEWHRNNGGLTTSAAPQHCNAEALLACRRGDGSIEAGHQRLDVSLDEDRRRVRTPKTMAGAGMFRRLTVSFAFAWLNLPARRRA